MNRQILTNEIMPDPNEVKPEAVREMGDIGDGGSFMRTVFAGLAFLSGIVALAIILSLL